MGGRGGGLGGGGRWNCHTGMLCYTALSPEMMAMLVAYMCASLHYKKMGVHNASRRAKMAIAVLCGAVQCGAAQQYAACAHTPFLAHLWPLGSPNH
jgi:hypothetical protein